MLASLAPDAALAQTETAPSAPPAAAAPAATDINSLIDEANTGNPIAESQLGRAYAAGDGLPQDDGLAMKWYQASAGHGYPDAEFYIGQAYFLGRGVPQDYSTALSWFEKAAQQGNPDIQYLVGIMYTEGLGTPTDYDDRRQMAAPVGGPGQ
ncbi:MAG: tetratricopeptide repeat protein [Asticcacaulis sp.]